MSNKVTLDVLGLNTPEIEVKQGVFASMYRYTYREEQSLKKIVSNSASLSYEIKKSDVGKQLDVLNNIHYKQTEENDLAFAGFLADAINKRIKSENDYVDVDFILDLQGNMRDLILYCLQNGQIPEQYTSAE